MKRFSVYALLCAIAALACVSCAKGPEDDVEPIADSSTTQGSTAELTPDAGHDKATMGSDTSENPLAKRLRLPDMTGLPTDKELAAKEKPDNGGGGVIARPPSE